MLLVLKNKESCRNRNISVMFFSSKVQPKMNVYNYILDCMFKLLRQAVAEHEQCQAKIKLDRGLIKLW